MTALRAWAALADVVGDAVIKALAIVAYSNATNATVSILYNATTNVGTNLCEELFGCDILHTTTLLQYFVAFSDPCDGAEFCPLMADALYGQMLGLYNGFDWHVNKSLIANHLRAEDAYSFDSSGFKVFSSLVC